jgi:CBS domain-containing protein
MSFKTKALSEKLVHVARAQVVCIQEDGSLKEGLALMRQSQAPCLMICRGQKLTGIFTERDYLMKVASQEKGGELIRDFMTANPIIASLENTIGEAIEIMNSKGLRHLPLVDQDGAPASVVTVSIIIQYLADLFPAAVVNRPPQPHVVSEEMDGA